MVVNQVAILPCAYVEQRVHGVHLQVTVIGPPTAEPGKRVPVIAFRHRELRSAIIAASLQACAALGSLFRRHMVFPSLCARKTFLVCMLWILRSKLHLNRDPNEAGEPS